MDDFGFIDNDTMTYESAWAGHDSGTATLPPGVVSSEDPNYWMVGGPPKSDGFEPVPPVTPLEERVYSAGHRVDHLDLDQNGFVKDGTFDPGFSGQDYVNKKLEAKGFKGACCGGCAGGGECDGACGGGGCTTSAIGDSAWPPWSSSDSSLGLSMDLRSVRYWHHGTTASFPGEGSPWTTWTWGPWDWHPDDPAFQGFLWCPCWELYWAYLAELWNVLAQLPSTWSKEEWGQALWALQKYAQLYEECRQTMPGGFLCPPLPPFPWWPYQDCCDLLGEGKLEEFLKCVGVGPDSGKNCCNAMGDIIDAIAQCVDDYSDFIKLMKKLSIRIGEHMDRIYGGNCGGFKAHVSANGADNFRHFGYGLFFGTVVVRAQELRDMLEAEESFRKGREDAREKQAEVHADRETLGAVMEMDRALRDTDLWFPYVRDAAWDQVWSEPGNIWRRRFCR